MLKKHNRSLLSLLLLFLFKPAFADVTAPIYGLFDAMREHDSQKLVEQFTDTAILQRALTNGSVRTTEISQFSQAISQSKSYLDEQLLSVHVKVSGNLASVWTPYVFYRDEKISHCGVNSFQLVENSVGWKIHYLIDNVYEGDCESFSAKMTE